MVVSGQRRPVAALYPGKGRAYLDSEATEKIICLFRGSPVHSVVKEYTYHSCQLWRETSVEHTFFNVNKRTELLSLKLVRVTALDELP